MDGGEAQLTSLVPPLAGVDPDDSFSSVPYERGMNFLFHLQQRVGKEPFHAFFKAYVEAFASTVVTSHGFRVFFTEHFTAAGAAAKIADVDWEGWLLKEGMPPVDPVYDLGLIAPVKELADDWVKVGLLLLQGSSTARTAAVAHPCSSPQRYLHEQALLMQR